MNDMFLQMKAVNWQRLTSYNAGAKACARGKGGGGASWWPAACHATRGKPMWTLIRKCVLLSPPLSFPPGRGGELRTTLLSVGMEWSCWCVGCKQRYQFPGHN
eukprot:scaffold193_cov203-Alexandrium_tamarense.AAC.18